MANDYSKKLLDPRWKEKRVDILNRDSHCCRFCGDSNKSMHVHHKFYIAGREPWEYDDSVLMTLCEGCHRLYHKLQKLNNKDYPPLFLPPHKSAATCVTAGEILKDDYFSVPSAKKRVPATIIRHLKLVMLLMDISKEMVETNNDKALNAAMEHLNELCLRSNVKLYFFDDVFGEGDVTDLKPLQYF